MSDPSLHRDLVNHRLICCMCIEWKDLDELFVDEDGMMWDYCKPCAANGAVAVVFAIMAGWQTYNLYGMHPDD